MSAGEPDPQTRDDGGRRGGIGWLVLLLVFLLVATTPFVITAIVMLTR